MFNVWVSTVFVDKLNYYNNLDLEGYNIINIV